MPRPRTLHAFSAAALGLALVGVPALPAFAGDDDGPAVTKDGSTYTLKLLETDSGDGDTYTPKGGEPTKEEPEGPPAAGDSFGFGAVLSQNGKDVGKDGGSCTVLSIDLDAKSAVNHCRVTLSFANGSLTVEGTIKFSEEQSTFDVPIVSGTGDYAGATGTMTVKDLSDDSGDDSEESDGPSLSDLTAVYTLPAAGSSGPAVTKDGSSYVIKVLETETGGGYVHQDGSVTNEEGPDRAPLPGEGFAFTSNLTQDGTKVGTDKGQCRFSNIDDEAQSADGHCIVTLTFADGTLHVDDTVAFSDDNNDFSLKLVSGTGAYSGATGTVTVHDLNTDDESDDAPSRSILTLRYTLGDAQVSEKPAGGAATGGGFSDSSNSAMVIGLGCLVALAGFGAVVGGRALGRRD